MNIIVRHTVLVSAALAIVGLSLVPAQAGTERAAKTEKTPYQQSLQAANCYNSLYCVVNFPATTAQTAIHNVSCWTVVSAGAVVQQLSLGFTNLDGNFAAVELPIFSAGPNGQGLTTGSNLQTLLFLDTGVAPTIFFQLDSGSLTYLNCTISGWTLAP